MPSLPLSAIARLESLPPDKQLAFSALFQGNNFTAAATQAGIGRVTLWRWLKFDPEFAALYEAWKQQLREAAHAGLLKTADAAVAAVNQAVAKGDAKIALALLRELGVLRPTQNAPFPFRCPTLRFLIPTPIPALHKSRPTTPPSPPMKHRETK